ncbi:efflux RND transporter permease subunit [Parasphingorhabdus sp.]|uniref:efflux RND transporter permease subunit n=1 Tax=Parasphingorhabdus sp. TaxID=2709688 RepID=UPI003A949087
MSRFFIDRPIFAWVIAVAMIIAGALAINNLPVSQFPAIAPPAVSITASYPGADAKTLENTTTQIIEQQLKGIDNLRYFSSSSSSAGTVTITLTFEQGTDPDTAQVQVQNKLQAATPLLPQEVQQQGVRVNKTTDSFLLVIGIVSEDGSHNGTDLGDLITSKLLDPISRVNGVGDTQVFGSPYSMRIWVDPIKLSSFQLTIPDVTAAIRAQNAQVSAGQLGALPAPDDQMLNAAVSVQSRLQTPEQFRGIVLKSSSDGAKVTLGDVARVELGAEIYSVTALYNGKPAAAFAINLAPGANALDTVEGVKAKVAEIARDFPSDVKVDYPLDTTPFVRLSIKQVVETLFEAVLLVFLVMFLFLQNWRATLIPTIAVPVVLMGSFAIMAVIGFSINTLTLFGMVLAIGLLVDDAIVVVENVERLMEEEGLSPKDAARKSMDEISGALIGIGLVLSAVFLPMAFFGGSTGVIFRQFSVTIISAMVLSVLVALILTPALCATMLKTRESNLADGTGRLAAFFRWFNRKFESGKVKYGHGVRKSVRNWPRSMLVYAVIIIGVGLIFLRLPSSFLPEEDQGEMFVLVQGPSGATEARTAKALDLVTNYLLEEEKDNVEGVFAINGFSFAGQGQNAGIAFVDLKDWDVRPGSENNVQAIAGRAAAKFQQYKDGMIIPIVPPAVSELGNATGFDMQLVDTGNIGYEALVGARNQLLGMAAQDPRVDQVRPVSLEDAPQLNVDIDLEKARALGLNISEINTTIASAWGSSYVNDFIDKGRVKRVYLQVDEQYRQRPDDIGKLFVRSQNGEMTPFTAFSTLTWAKAPVQLTRYNGQPAMQIQGVPGAGLSSGDAITAMEELQAKLPPGTSLEWTGLSYEEQSAGSQSALLYSLSLLIVFLCLAALYESWWIPLSVMLVVPLGVFGALAVAAMSGLDNDIYLQVALITTMGVAAKNAILIIEFAQEKIAGGMNAFEATVDAAAQRLRPILMTSLAFVFGVLPLAITTGAGAGGQNAIGRAVAGGMTAATILAIFLVPTFFIVAARFLGGVDTTEPETVQEKDSKKDPETDGSTTIATED